MLIVPIGTDVRLRGAPVGNWVLVGLNVAIHFLFASVPGGDGVKSWFALNAALPSLSQYLSYQFLHGDVMHLAGNMLFLWIFGNAVCDRMGSLPYILFYLAGGVFAGSVFAAYNQNPLVGASGSIAAVTTAFMVLFPRVNVLMVFWMFVVTTFQVPAILLILVKIVLWDNIVAPSIDARAGVVSNVAYTAHLGGYFFGFVVPMLLLLLRGLPRNQFDLLALINRWRRRVGLTSGSPVVIPQRARMAQAEVIHARPLSSRPASPLDALREEIIDRINERDTDEALRLYERLGDAGAVALPRATQLEIANQLAQRQRHSAAAHAYEGFLRAYPTAPEAPQIALMLGLIYARYLGQPERAASLLRAAQERAVLESHRAIAAAELEKLGLT